MELKGWVENMGMKIEHLNVMTGETKKNDLLQEEVNNRKTGKGKDDSEKTSWTVYFWTFSDDTRGEVITQ